ncbi:hypothetical protein E2C01_060377 [Portunus trituberculatus]|uniref:Secreted protein n=1 Tax=Portunus trituberculatus TaxID=210409 RepID=A0A5B7H8P6_PORTR|nr:hypothetical protein [Portunus trituberculatus]
MFLPINVGARSPRPSLRVLLLLLLLLLLLHRLGNECRFETASSSKLSRSLRGLGGDVRLMVALINYERVSAAASAALCPANARLFHFFLVNISAVRYRRDFEYLICCNQELILLKISVCRKRI